MNAIYLRCEPLFSEVVAVAIVSGIPQECREADLRDLPEEADIYGIRAHLCGQCGLNHQQTAMCCGHTTTAIPF